MYNIKKLAYELEIDGAKINVILDGCTVAGLDVRSAVHQTSDDLKTIRDEEPEIPALVSAEEVNGNMLFTWKNKSALWKEKTYTLECTPLRFIYKVSVKGQGRVDGIEYFTGVKFLQVHRKSFPTHLCRFFFCGIIAQILS